jgi:hypothetical protein
LNRENKEFYGEFNDTLHQHEFDVGATFTFKDGNRISEHNAVYTLKLFFNELSEVYFGKHRDRSNAHVERVVFVHRTHKGGRFIHFHCALKSVGNKDAFKIAVSKVWKKYIYNGMDVHFENVQTGFGLYGMREQSNWNSIKLEGSGTGKHKGKQLVTDTNDSNWMHDLQHIDSGTSYYTKQQKALDKHTNNRLRKLFYEKNKLIEVRRLLKQEQLYEMSEAQINSVINSSI